MSLDQFASSSGEPLAPRPQAAAAEPPEAYEDLFDFDELLSAPKTQAPLSQDLKEVLEAVESAKSDVARDVVAPASPARAVAAPLRAESVAPPTSATALAPAPNIKHIEPSRASAPAPAPATIVHQKLSMSPLAAVLLGAIVLANVTLMLVAWGSVQSVKQLVLDVTHDVADTTSELRAESTRRSELVALESEPVFGALPEGYRTLEIAKDRLQRGEHARARRMLYGLLSVVDRVEQPARSEVEAQAGFLIADSFRLEADALGKERTP